MLLSYLARGMRSLALLVGLAYLPSFTSAAYPSPGACNGHCWAHDPSVVKRADGTYFLFNTGGGIGISKASSLSGSWTYEGSALSRSSLTVPGNAGTDLWAPMVQLVGSTYYLFYSVSTFGSKVSAIGYATSTTMEVGSWTDHGATGIASGSSTIYNAIDASVFTDAAGAYHMTFGSFWNDIYSVPMANPPTRATGTPFNIAYNASGDHAQEGSSVYFRGTTGHYYLFFSAGACCGYHTNKPPQGLEYSIRVCRSTSVRGPFVDARGVSCAAGGGTTVLASHDFVYGPGGQGLLVDTAHGGAVLYYHYADTRVGLADANYLFGWNALSWSTGWPVPV